jgi:hypothetical protein
VSTWTRRQPTTGTTTTDTTRSERHQKCTTVVIVTGVVTFGTGTLAVTVTADPAGTLERTASAAPALSVSAGVVMNPTGAEKLTVTPTQTRPLISRTIASRDAEGAGPVLTEDVIVMVAGIFVVDGVTVGRVLLAQPTLKPATSKRIQRIQPI